MMLSYSNQVLRRLGLYLIAWTPEVAGAIH